MPVFKGPGPGPDQRARVLSAACREGGLCRRATPSPGPGQAPPCEHALPCLGLEAPWVGEREGRECGPGRVRCPHQPSWGLRRPLFWQVLWGHLEGGG